MAYQPRGIFVGDTPDELAAMKTAARARINGQVTSVSEAGQSYTQSLGMAPDEVLIEVAYAMQAAAGTLPARQSRPNFGGVAGTCGYGYDPSRSDFL